MSDHGSGFAEPKDVVGNLTKVKGVLGDFTPWKAASEDGHTAPHSIDGITPKALERGGV